MQIMSVSYLHVLGSERSKTRSVLGNAPLGLHT